MSFVGPGLRPADHAVAAALLPLGFVAIGVGGSRAMGVDDTASDTDLYACYRGTLPAEDARARALRPLADDGELAADETWGSCDLLRIDGHLFDVVYLDLDELGVDAFYDPGVWPTGYTTAFLHTLARCLVVADPAGDLAALQARLATYPEATRAKLLERLPVELAGYVEQVTTAQRRADWTSVTHRRTALQVAWFDLVFAINRRYHPGEKRLLDHVLTCSLVPDDAVARWTRASVLPADDPVLVEVLAALATDAIELGRRYAA